MSILRPRCRELTLAVTNNAGIVFRLALQGLGALQESGEAGTRVAALQASGADQLAKINVLRSHQRELLDENRLLEHQLVWLGWRWSVMKVKHGEHKSRYCRNS